MDYSVASFQKPFLTIALTLVGLAIFNHVTDAQMYSDHFVSGPNNFGVTSRSPDRNIESANSMNCGWSGCQSKVCRCACERLDTLTSFLGIDGSKQPQDFGANANLGVAAQLNYSAPLIANSGIGIQIGSRVNFSANAVQVYELLGESKDRVQYFTTVGLFQRLDSGVSYGVVYDYLMQESFDNFTLGQWRFRASYELSPSIEVGTTLNFSDRNDLGSFNADLVVLDPVDQFNVYLKNHWPSGVNTTLWIGVADKHSEENAITGTLPPKANQMLFGAEIFAPLNNWLAIYGETNLMMPADTGAVDAYLGIEFAPQGIFRSRSRQNRFRSFLPVASNPTFTTDLNRR